MDNRTFLDHLERDSADLIAAALADLTRPIDHIEGWTLRDLAGHIGAVWTTMITQVEAATDEPTPSGPIAEAPAGDAIGDWLYGRRATMLDLLRAVDPDAPAYTFTGPLTAAWWIRRMTHETSVHRWDAQVSAGQEPAPIDGDLGTDGIDEYAEVSLRVSLRRPDRIYPAETLHLHRTDGPGEWMFSRGAEPHQVVVTHEHGKGDAAVRGPGGDLLLWIWGRPVDGLEFFGDTAVAEAWQAVAP